MQPVALEPKQPRGLKRIAQDAVVVAAAVWAAQHGDVAAVAAVIQVDLHGACIGQHGVNGPRHFTPASGGVRLEAGQPVAWRVGRPRACGHDCQHGQWQDQQPCMHRQARRR